MIYLVGSVALRLMALTFLFPALSRYTLALVRPGYYEALAARPAFAFQLGIDILMVLLGLSLLLRNTSRQLLGQAEAGGLAILRAIVMSALTAVAILMTLMSLRGLGVIGALSQDGVMMVALGFWTLFFTCCIFPGWYARKVFDGVAGPVHDDDMPVFVAVPARYMQLDTRPRPGTRAPREGWRLARPPGTAHMGLKGWLVTLLTAALFAAIIAGGVHGRVGAHFFPSDGYSANVDRLLLPLGVICGALLVLFVFLGPRPERRTALGSPFWRTVAAIAVFYFGFYLCADPALRLGLADYHAQRFGGTALRIPAEVVAQEQNYRRHRCNRTAILRMDVGEGRREYLVCDLPPQLWETLARGQILTVAGVRTAYGFRYERIGRGPPSA